MDTPTHQRSSSAHVYVRPLTRRDLDACVKITTSPNLGRYEVNEILAAHSPTTLGIFTTPPVPASTARPPTPSLHPHEEIMVGYILATLSKPEEEHGQGPFLTVKETQAEEDILKVTLIKSWIGRMRDAKIARKIILQEGAVRGEEERGVWEKTGFVRDEGGWVLYGL
ncbi:hypothetical protein EX30DRAFT_371429 [Ascodesmis nigricans]|uniref:N-acetyltransferase domain-containing protein n=1 Tax=Ascodesmis nigricans TaxID=341454 RepID=A0A4S2MXJ6_9PEZI|nr:hypothetical protein EX30DRAFT_371429 [Ascodesmis nigricans]